MLQAGNDDEFEPAFTSLTALHAGALLVGNDPSFYTRREKLVSLAVRYRVPAIYEWHESAVIGGLASYGTGIVVMYGHLGAYFARVLAGAKPADLPIEQPTKFELVINMKTATALGLSVPPAILVLADEIVE